MSGDSMVTKITITIEIDGNSVVVTQPITIPTPQTPIVLPEQTISQPTKPVSKQPEVICLKYNKVANFKKAGSCTYCNIRHGCYFRDYTFDKDGILQNTGPVIQGPVKQVPVKEIIIPLEC